MTRRLGTSETSEPYRWLRQLGTGGMAEVWLAEESPSGRQVAVKLPLPQHRASPEYRRRFLEEARLAASVCHPRVLPILDIGEFADGTPYLVMPYVAGPTLKDRLAAEGALPWRESLEVAQGILDALEYAHAKGIVHRDLNPSNVLLSPQGELFVADFGIARAVGRESMTHTGTFMGTPYYLAPEQASGQPVDHRADLYAVGCVLFEMLTGRPPFEGDTPLAVIRQHRSSPSPTIPHMGFPQGLPEVLAKAMAKRPQDRYASASELRSDLETVWAGRGSEIASRLQPHLARFSAPLSMGRRLAVGRYALAGMAVALVMATLGAGGVLAAEHAPGWVRGVAAAVGSLISPISPKAQPPEAGSETTPVTLSDPLVAPDIDYLRERIAEAMTHRDWDLALETARSMMEIWPANEEIRQLHLAVRSEWLHARYREGVRAQINRDFGAATKIFSRILQEEPGYRDVEARYEEARAQEELRSSYLAANDLLAAEEYEQAAARYRSILAARPGYEDVGARLAATHVLSGRAAVIYDMSPPIPCWPLYYLCQHGDGTLQVDALDRGGLAGGWGAPGVFPSAVPSTAETVVWELTLQVTQAQRDAPSEVEMDFLTGAYYQPGRVSLALDLPRRTYEFVEQGNRFGHKSAQSHSLPDVGRDFIWHVGCTSGDTIFSMVDARYLDSYVASRCNPAYGQVVVWGVHVILYRMRVLVLY